MLGKFGDACFVDIMKMVIGSFISLQLFQLLQEIMEIKLFLQKGATSLSHIEISASLSCGNLVKILRSHFEKLNYIQMRLQSLVGDRHDTARMLCQIVEDYWGAEAELNT